MGEEYNSFSSSLCNLLHSPVSLLLYDVEKYIYIYNIYIYYIYCKLDT